jgi:hypothetical protein
MSQKTEGSHDAEPFIFWRIQEADDEAHSRKPERLRANIPELNVQTDARLERFLLSRLWIITTSIIPAQ